MPSNETLQEKTNRTFGFDPNVERLSLLPYPQGASARAKDPNQAIDWSDWVAPKALVDLAEAFTLPGHVAEGGSWNVGDALNFTGNLLGMGGSLGAAVGIPKNSLGIFGGELSRSADLPKLYGAIARLEKNEDPAVVWRETGWAKGPDGKMVYEIPDNDATLKNSNLGEFNIYGRVPQNTILSHPELYDAYPSATNIPVRLQDDIGASFKGQTIYLNRKNVEHAIFGDEFGDIDRYLDKLLNYNLHELQHYVASVEGFMPGGAPSMFPGSKKEATKLYTSLYGEALPRLVQSRQNMSPLDRRESYPFSPKNFFEGTGVRLKDLILSDQQANQFKKPEFQLKSVPEKKSTAPFGFLNPDDV
jgi:hypothetical protein